MSKPNVTSLLVVGLSAISLVGCKDLPGSKGTQGAVIGGAGGATVGALVGGEHHRLLGALVGGAVGAGGGYLIGANSDHITGHNHSGAEKAARSAQEHPATAQDAARASTADLNGDGFVTMDEVAAMRDAGLSDAQMLQRLQATGQVFELTPEQRQFLLNRGVSQYVVDQMPNLNRETRDRLLTTPPPTTVTPSVVQPTTAPPPTLTIPPGSPLPAATPPVGTPPVLSQPPTAPPATIPQTLPQ
jgi:hypothetical protein